MRYVNIMKATPTAGTVRYEGALTCPRLNESIRELTQISICILRAFPVRLTQVSNISRQAS